MSHLVFSDWFDTDALMSLPREKRLAVCADYIELLVVTSMDKSYSLSTLLDRYGEEREFSPEGNIESHTLGEDDLDIHFFEEETIEDDLTSKLARCFEYRCKKFSGLWPFSFNHDELVLTFKPHCEGGDLYLFLLLSSSLRCIKKKQSHIFTSTFEKAGYEFLEKLYPTKAGWVIKGFGANQQFSNSYGGLPLEKFTALASDLNCEVNSRYQPTSSGDGGIDILAYHTWGDGRGVMPLVVMQCGCAASKNEMENKIFEASYANLCNKLHLDTYLTSFFSTPHDLFNTDRLSRWELENTNLTVIVDRLRILSMLKNNTFVSSVHHYIQQLSLAKLNPTIF